MAQIIPFPQAFRPFYANYMGPRAEVIVLPKVRTGQPRRSTLGERAKALRDRFNPKVITVVFKDER